MNIIHKLKIKLSKESLEDTRKRIRREIKQYNNTGISTNPLSQAIDGYFKNRNVNYDN